MKGHRISSRSDWRLGWLCLLTALVGTPTALGSDLDGAQAAWAAGDLKSAAITLRDLLQRDPGDPAARLLLARLYLDLGQGAAAAQELERAARLGVPPEGLRVLQVDALLKQGQFLQARDAARRGPSPADIEQAATLLAQEGEAYLGLADTAAAGRAFAEALQVRPGLTRARLGQARLAMLTEGGARAQELIQQALADEPGSAQALEMLGDLEQARANIAAAADAYTKALAQGRNQWMLHYKRALAHTELRAFDEASADIAAAERQFPDFTGLHYARGRLLLEQGRADEALPEFEVFVGIMPNNPQALFYAGLAAYQNGKLERAEQYLAQFNIANPSVVSGAKVLALVRMARKDFAAAEAVLAPFARAEKPDPEVLTAYSRALTALGRQDDATTTLSQAARLHPEIAAARLALADQLVGGGQTDAALKELDAVLKEDQHNRKARLLRIKALLQAKETQTALGEAQALTQAAPRDAQAYNALALCQIALGQEQRARESFARALDLEPGMFNAAFNLAQLELAAQRPEAARTLYEQILAKDPANTRVILALAQLEVGMGDTLGALERLEAAVRAKPRDIDLRTNLAQGYLSADYLQRAWAVVHDAQDEAADDPRLLLVRGQLEMKMGQWSDAAKTFDLVIRTQPASAGPHLLLSMAHAGGGDVAGMEEQLLAGVTIDAENPLVQPAIARALGTLPDADARAALVEKLAAVTGTHALVTPAQTEAAMDQGDYAKAIQNLRSLRETRPNDPAVFEELFRTLVAANELETATSTADAWLAAHPDDDRTRSMLAQVYLRRGARAEAVAAYREILARSPNNPPILNNLAIALRETDTDQALSYAEQAHRLRSADPAIADTLGSLLLAKGDGARAAEVLAPAYAALPENPTLGFHYASALAAVGREKEARGILLELVQRPFAEQEEARSLLARLSDSTDH